MQNVGMDSVDMAKVEKAGLKLKPYGYMTETSMFDMSFFCAEGECNLIFTIKYCTKLFKRETIEMFISYFKEIVSTVIENNEILLKDINISQDILMTDTSVPQYEFAF
jgi:hypothetical protein